ncbi:hypothetical protein ACI2JC_21025 [Pseudomonas fulva]|uniref:hypothetical protein n=1 Tax=Pseudomonas fulva TaxID=47880 RepID=UPI00384C3BEB
MPTENRSSNTEMVSVPEGFMLVERSIWTEQQVEAATACITRLKGVPGMRDCDLAMAAIDAAQCKAPDIALSDLLPTLQPHPDPIAWMVGTAIWWTKEEAERDAAETGLPVVGLGPMAMAAHAVQHQGELVALPLRKTHKKGNSPMQNAKNSAWNACLNEIAKLGPLYTQADTAEIERLRSQLNALEELAKEEAGEVERLRTRLEEELSLHVGAELKHEKERDTLRAQLAEAQALLQAVREARRVAHHYHSGNGMLDWIEGEAKRLSASEEPSALNDCAICRDLGNQCMECEEGEFRQWADRHFAAADYRKTDAGVFIQDWMRHSYGAWRARGALVSKK